MPNRNILQIKGFVGLRRVLVFVGLFKKMEVSNLNKYTVPLKGFPTYFAFEGVPFRGLYFFPLSVLVNIPHVFSQTRGISKIFLTHSAVKSSFTILVVVFIIKFAILRFTLNPKGTRPTVKFYFGHTFFKILNI